SAMPTCRSRDRLGIEAESPTFENISGPAIGTDYVLRPARITKRLDVVAEVAAERVGLLHQRSSRDDLNDLPEVFLVLHVLLRLAFDNDDRTDALVVFRTIMHVADEGR